MKNMRKTGGLRLSIPAAPPFQPKDIDTNSCTTSPHHLPHHLPPLPTRILYAHNTHSQHVIQDTPTNCFNCGDNQSNDPYAATGPVQVLTEGLYISGRTAAESLDTLRALAVGLVINVAGEVENMLFDDDDSGRVEGLALTGGGDEWFFAGGDDTAELLTNQNHAFDNNRKQRHLKAYDNVVGHYCPRITPYSRPLSPTPSAAQSLSQISKSSSIQQNLQKPVAMLPGYIKFSWDHAASTVESDTLMRALRLIDAFLDAGKSVLVSCNQGVSRSASLVIASVMRRRAMRMSDAYGFVKRKSVVICPNLNLLGRLIQLEEKFVESE
ncbi:Dual specificity protein phosphatase 10 [Physocladia obscura]|uniref:protein-tyrosine-phosphatase n=1 Tax=Physocladia obscura TaxID=109957 RepID=A0AAD5SMP0_9FUNG|nr:Dual specificity protein phosphatase 10 [Physocladia obscura]